MENTLNTGFSFDLPKGNSSIIKVIGVGGGGNNALKHMYEKGIHGVDFIICNTDAQTLDNNPISTKVQLGAAITEGLGAGADPEVGEKSALESIDEIKAVLGHNTKMVFITAGMGGGTGTGAAPVIAKIAKEMGILTIGIVTVPFSFEGKRRLEQAENGLEKLRNNVDSLIVINNDKLRQQFGNLGFKSGFAKADEVLANAAKGMAEVITGYFDVNIDFRDARSVLQNSGTALMSTGTASGENKAEEAVKKALDSPLLNDNKITGAKNVLLLIRSGNEEATMDEIGLINDHIQREAGNTADIIFGVGTDAELGDSISVLVIATGFAADDQKYAGPTEKIRYTLEDTPSSPKVKRESPFGRTSSEKSQENPMQNSSKSMFFLDDSHDNSTPDFPSNSVNQFAETQAAVLEERIEELRFFEDESLSIESSHQTFEVEEQENNVLELFSFDDEDVLESQSFTFETEEKKTTIIEETQFDAGQKVENVKLSLEETKEEISFIVEEKTVETYRPKAETKTLVEEKPIEFTFKIAEEIEEVKTVFENHTEEKITFTETKIEEEFKFIEKNTATEKVQARRDKLKEFNSRYQTIENENEFENIPAFRRKNINIGHENASQQQISSFLSENNGRVQLRENKFLNKDVD
ncbi:cell division protein FtsZ [Cloacibacterium normanense]|uniref:Cell division protein FtsZ n=1 Tax=Cloacibacterium normanense TaxID=237258 RepID=A0A2S7I6G9_9FLAO|nr:cell division protein FtsZ [Cloacibacterium normanense]PPZ92125.1 cell division protein FtsZ [Cloacibacterium normanense]